MLSAAIARNQPGSNREQITTAAVTHYRFSPPTSWRRPTHPCDPYPDSNGQARRHGKRALCFDQASASAWPSQNQRCCCFASTKRLQKRQSPGPTYVSKRCASRQKVPDVASLFKPGHTIIGHRESKRASQTQSRQGDQHKTTATLSIRIIHINNIIHHS